MKYELKNPMEQSSKTKRCFSEKTTKIVDPSKTNKKERGMSSVKNEKKCTL